MNVFTDEMRRDPFPIYARMRSASPVLRMPGAEVWMILDYEGVRRALHDHETWSSRAAPPGGKPFDWLIFSDPPRHTKLRALIMRAFTPKVVLALEPRIWDLSRELLDRTIERGEMDLCADYAVPLPLMVIAEMLGIPSDDRPRFRRWCDAIIGLADTVGGGDEAVRAGAVFRAASDEMRPYLADLLAERRAAPREDLLSLLVKAEVDGERLTEGDLLAFFQLLLLAGSETTTNLISNAVLCLLAHPEALSHLQTSPDLWPSAIEEVLRYRSPLQAVFRSATRDVELSGQVIPAGKLVLALVGSANRDPLAFPDPDRFDITRDPNPHVAFGHGIHFCIGAPLSRLEARVALPDLFSRLEGLALAEEGPWEPRKAFNVHGPARLPVRFAPGNRLSR